MIAYKIIIDNIGTYDILDIWYNKQVQIQGGHGSNSLSKFL